MKSPHHWCDDAGITGEFHAVSRTIRFGPALFKGAYLSLPTALKVRQLSSFNLLTCRLPVKDFCVIFRPAAVRVESLYGLVQMQQPELAVALGIFDAGMAEQQLDAAEATAAD